YTYSFTTENYLLAQLAALPTNRGAVRGGLRVRWRLPARARAARIALVEQHHLADRLAAGEAVEAGVDVVQRQRMREQPVHRQASGAMQGDVAGDVALRHRRTHVRAFLRPLLGH